MSPNDYVSLGNQMGMTGDHIGASKFFKNVMKIDPYYIPAYLGLGIVMETWGRMKMPLKFLKKGLN